MATVFDEQALRSEIVRVWGEYGAHVEVFDMLIADRDGWRECAEENRALVAELRAERDEWKARAKASEYDAETARLIEKHIPKSLLGFVYSSTPRPCWTAWVGPGKSSESPTLGEAVRAAVEAE